jgi:putative ABC transport system permease protein
VVGLAVTLLAALLPALRASRTSPLQAMRRRAEVVGRPAWRSAVAGLVVIAASVPGVWLLSRDDLSAAAEAYGTVAIIGIFLGVALATPLVVRPLVRALAVPLRLAGRTEGRLAADNAARAPGRTALTASAVMIGLALVITFSAFSASAVSAVRDSIDRSLASDFIVVPQNLFSTQGFSPALAREVAALPGARAVSSSRVGAASVDGRVTEVIAVDPETYGEVATTTLVDGGRPDWAALGGPAVLVTQGLADERGLGVGSTITLGGAGTGPEDLRVAGVLDDRLESQSGRAVFVSQRRGVGLGLTQDLRVYAQAGDSPEARAALRQELERAVGAYPAAELLSNEELKNEIESSLNQVFGLLYALLGVAIVAAAVGIANTLAMSVIERTREIGMIRAVGGTRSQLRRMIRRESVLVTMVGVVLGLGVGLLLGYAFVRASAAQFPGLVFRVPWTAVIAVLVGAVVVAVLAAALPARRAARLSVIEAVSYE